MASQRNTQFHCDLKLQTSWNHPGAKRTVFLINLLLLKIHNIQFRCMKRARFSQGDINSIWLKIMADLRKPSLEAQESIQAIWCTALQAKILRDYPGKILQAWGKARRCWGEIRFMMMDSSWKAWWSLLTTNEIHKMKNNTKWISFQMIKRGKTDKQAIKERLVRGEKNVLLSANWMPCWNRISAGIHAPRFWSRHSSQVRARAVSYQ